MSTEDAPFHRAPLLASHRSDVKWIRGLFVRLLQRSAVDQLHVRNGYKSGLPGILDPRDRGGERPEQPENHR
jgi:hypothetical protein